MSLLDKKSKYDRHTRGVIGNTVGGPDGTGPNPEDGPYYYIEGGVGEHGLSPFIGKMGLTSDQMVALLKSNISTHTGNTYFAAPSKSPYQDLDIDIVSNDPPRYEDNPPG